MDTTNQIVLDDPNRLNIVYIYDMLALTFYKIPEMNSSATWE